MKTIHTALFSFPFMPFMKLALSGLLLLGAIDALGQCSQALERAQRTYESGKLEEIPSLLAGCFANGFTQNERERAYRLLTLVYLYTDQAERAEEALMNLLKEAPEYKINSTDPAEFIALYRKFRTTPIASIGVKFGPNISYVQVENIFGVQNTQLAPGNYGTQLGYQVGISADIPLLPFLEFTPEALLQQQSFTYANNMFDYTQVTLTENQTWWLFPASLKLLFGTKKFRPFVEGGLAWGVLQTAEGEVARTFLPNIGEIIEREPQDQTVSLSEAKLRKPTMAWYFAGLGFKYKIPRAFISLSTRFTRAASYLVETENRYTNSDLIYRYGYVDDDFKIDNLQFNLRVLYCLYKPKKLKRRSR